MFLIFLSYPKMLIKKFNFLKKNWIKKILRGDTFSYPDISSIVSIQKRKEYVDWIYLDSVSIVEDFFNANKSTHKFISAMNKIYNTNKFGNLFKKYVIDYLYHIFLLLDYYCFEVLSTHKLELEDNSLNRFAVLNYKTKFNIEPNIKWFKQPNLVLRLLIIFFHACKILYYGIKNGVSIFEKRKQYKVMRMLVMGFKGINGYYLHDDFMVDGEKIQPKELLIFTRGKPNDYFAQKTYETMINSPYDSFDIETLPISIKIFIFRIIPKYLLSGCLTLLFCVNSSSFTLFSSIYYRFIAIGILHEKVFSRYKICSQLGHQSYSYTHIIEAIICNNHGAKYYLCQFSDATLLENKQVFSFLGCDYIFAWGKAHKAILETNPNTFLPTGYLFKSFIKQVDSIKSDIIAQMKLNNGRRNIVFFEEDFGGVNNITEESYIYYWETIFAVWKKIKNDINLIFKPKDPLIYLGLSEKLKKRYLEIMNCLSKSENFYILGSPKWSFIELIGIADVVITHGLTSSTTIAIICGIEGIYFSRENSPHPFARLFQNKVVFCDSDKLVEMIEKIIAGKDSVFKIIPENLLQEFNNNGCALDLTRDIFLGNYDTLRINEIILNN